MEQVTTTLKSQNSTLEADIAQCRVLLSRMEERGRCLIDTGGFEPGSTFAFTLAREAEAAPADSLYAWPSADMSHLLKAQLAQQKRDYIDLQARVRSLRDASFTPRC